MCKTMSPEKVLAAGFKSLGDLAFNVIQSIHDRHGVWVAYGYELVEGLASYPHACFVRYADGTKSYEGWDDLEGCVLSGGLTNCLVVGPVSYPDSVRLFVFTDPAAIVYYAKFRPFETWGM